ncbi:malonyl-ACP O-methyltransferase BioC [Salinithrix halophila]|uniref:Malonyl-[acyl-carrier protein] O-methyltransferase n=1 Tax=Salinithrix halophila TaxID=1485204 RepID=A0ABV8JNN8_9BACL
MIDKTGVMRRFSRSSATYDQNAAIQRKMGLELLEAVRPAAGKVRRILEIGCGTGFLTEALRRMFASAELLAVDMAPGMVEAARARVGEYSGVTFLVGDAEEVNWAEKGSFDLIISNATVQWFARPETTLRHLAEALEPGGLAAVSTFGPGTFGELHTLFREVEEAWGISPSRHGLTLRGKEHWERLLREAGLVAGGSHAHPYRFTYGDCRGFLRSVRGMGANHSEGGVSPVMAGRILSEVMDRYDQRFRAGSGVYATYEAVWVWGKRV